MSFIKRIKKVLNQAVFRGYPRGQVLVDEKDLEELVNHFERLDASARLTDAFHKNNDDYHLLRCSIEQMWYSNDKKSDEIMYVFTEELSRLQKEKFKQSPQQNRFTKFKL